ncbi:Uncharacterised protein [uncultured archaeon]|nr:Uncharacterised protein [uncultured archaeon]
MGWRKRWAAECRRKKITDVLPGMLPDDLKGRPFAERVRLLPGSAYEILRIEDRDFVANGGINVLSCWDASKPYVSRTRCDLSEFEPFFEAAHSRAEGLSPDHVKMVQNIFYEFHLNPKLLRRLYAFTMQLEEDYPADDDMVKAKCEIYFRPEYSWGHELPCLSSIFKLHAATCLEDSVLAQYFLQREGANSSIFVGSMIDADDAKKFFAVPEPEPHPLFAAFVAKLRKKEPAPEPTIKPDGHAFIVIRDGGRIYVFDPANPIRHPNWGVFPRVYRMNHKFDLFMQGKTGGTELVNARMASGEGPGGRQYYGINKGYALTKENWEKAVLEP